MTGILAIETATEACSVALWRDGECVDRHESVPREHNRRLFAMLRELLPGGDLRAGGVDAIAWGSGPGSFTGLRIAASAVQGIAFASALPAIAVSTLTCLAQTALRLGVVNAGDTVVSMLDARIDELYCATCQFEGGVAVMREGPVACSPEAVTVGAGAARLLAVGSGCRYADRLPADLRERTQCAAPELLPAARDLVPQALDLLRRGETQAPQQVQPLYVRDEIHWKKLSEQGGRP